MLKETGAIISNKTLFLLLRGLWKGREERERGRERVLPWYLPPVFHFHTLF